MEMVTISGYQDVPANDEQSLIKALAHQPLSVAIDASDRDFQFYSGVSLLNTDTHTYIYTLSFSCEIICTVYKFLDYLGLPGSV